MVELVVTLGIIGVLASIAVVNVSPKQHFTTAPPDTTPPVISSVAASGITRTAATITWTTNEPANARVDYGLTTAYGSQSALRASLLTTHTRNLSGLTRNTTYHYRARSTDASANLGLSGDFTFTTNP